MNKSHQKVKRENNLSESEARTTKTKPYIETAFHDISDGPRLGKLIFKTYKSFIQNHKWGIGYL